MRVKLELFPVFDTREEAEACRGDRNTEIYKIEEIKEATDD